MENNPKLSQIIKYQEKYLDIKDSRVSWRKKSSYRKSIKRWASKVRRRGDNILIWKSTQVL